VNFQVLKKLAEKGMAIGVPLITHPDQLCQACLIAKQTRQPFPAAARYRAKEPLELLHIDLCGPIKSSTAAGNRFFMLIVDDYSRWMWIHLLKTKDQACLAFKKTKVLAENASNRRIKVLLSDQGGKFLLTELAQVCEEAGIEHHFTAPYSPQKMVL
jgi:transposase InsO family protein